LIVFKNYLKYAKLIFNAHKNEIFAEQLSNPSAWNAKIAKPVPVKSLKLKA